MRPVLEVDNLSFSFDGRNVLRGITFTAGEGECVGIAGANGAGKSTLLWCLMGLLRFRGSVRVFGEKPGTTTVARTGFVFQNPEDQLFMPSVAEDIVLTLINRGLSKEEAFRRVPETLALVGLGEEASMPASQLSLGQRKRASIAAALASSPELLLLDEPTAELDGRSVRLLGETLRNLPITRVIASHHLDFLRGLCSRVLVLTAGTIVASGPASEILANAALLERAGLI